MGAYGNVKRCGCSVYTQRIYQKKPKSLEILEGKVDCRKTCSGQNERKAGNKEKHVVIEVSLEKGAIPVGDEEGGDSKKGSDESGNLSEESKYKRCSNEDLQDARNGGGNGSVHNFYVFKNRREIRISFECLDKAKLNKNNPHCYSDEKGCKNRKGEEVGKCVEHKKSIALLSMVD
jgi:hypothetical protein